MICTHFYSLADGVFTGRKSWSPDASFPLSIPEGCGAYVGDDVSGKRVDLATGDLVDYLPPMPTDGGGQIASVAARVRADRDARLTACDWVVAHSAETAQPIPQEWRSYRTALRDMTTQAGFPLEVEWPTPPKR